MSHASPFPGPTEIQSLIFGRDRFTARNAKIWARDHGFVTHKVEEQERTIRLRQWDPSEAIDGTFRTIPLTDGIQAVVAVSEGRRGDWKRHRALRREARLPVGEGGWTPAEVGLIVADIAAPDPMPGMPGPVAVGVLVQHGLRRTARAPARPCRRAFL